MASSSSILLWPLGRLSPSGSFNVQKCVHGSGAQRLSIVCHGRGKGGAEHERAKLNIVTRRMRLLLESEGLLANEAAFSLVNSMSTAGRTVLISALFPGKLSISKKLEFFYQIIILKKISGQITEWMHHVVLATFASLFLHTR